MPEQPPVMSAYGRHVFLCAGRFCDPEERAATLYNHLPALLGELGDYDNPQRVKRGLAACLGVCAGGPLMVVYPDGVWYHHVDAVLLEQIVEEHLKQNRVVEAAVFHQFGEG
jgi:(2Fe-2S) ferredoxin